MRKYAIVCGSRSGSTYLCKLLKSTKRCGMPEEYFNPAFKYPSDRHELLKQYRTENDVFGVKIVGLSQWQTYLDSQLQISHWIWLRREDEVLQAISRYIAYTTNGWHRKTTAPPYSFEGIKWCLEEIKKENNFYQDFFNNTECLELSYERDVCENAVSTVTSVLAYLNINLEELGKFSIVKKETDSLNQQWKHKFNEEIATEVRQPE